MDRSDDKYDFRRYSFFYATRIFEWYKHRKHSIWNNAEILLVFALILEIPIVMIFLSRILKNKFNRWANIIASLITIIFVIGGGSLALHYIFFATVEVLVLLLIIRYAWELK